MGSRPLEGFGQLWAQDAAGRSDTELEVSNGADPAVLGCSGRHEPTFHGEVCCLFILGTSALASLAVSLKPEEDLVIVIVIVST